MEDIEANGFRIVPTAEAVSDVLDQREREQTPNRSRFQRIIDKLSRAATAMAHSEID